MPGRELPGSISFLNPIPILQFYGVEAAVSRLLHHSLDSPDPYHGSQNCPFGRAPVFLYPYLGWIDPEIAPGVALGVGPELGSASLRIWGLGRVLLKPFL